MGGLIRGRRTVEPDLVTRIIRPDRHLPGVGAGVSLQGAGPHVADHVDCRDHARAGINAAPPPAESVATFPALRSTCRPIPRPGNPA